MGKKIKCTHTPSRIEKYSTPKSLPRARTAADVKPGTSEQPPHITTEPVSQSESPVMQPTGLASGASDSLPPLLNAQNGPSESSHLGPPPSQDLQSHHRRQSSSSPLPLVASSGNLPEQKIIPGLVHERARKGSTYSNSSSPHADFHSSPSRHDNDGNDYGVV